MPSLFSLILVFNYFILITSIEPRQSNESFDYLILVNKEYKLPDDYISKVNLINVTNNITTDNRTFQIEKTTFEYFVQLREELLEEDDIRIEIDSVYRSVQRQQEIWDEFVREKGEEYAKKYVAKPGYSEHHTGLAVDICIKKDGKLIYDNDEMIAEREIFAKIHKKLAKYGFILRYLEGREDSTGYTYEPWHLRYINSPEIAKEIMDKKITFEEYLNSRKNLKEVPEAVKYKIEITLQEYFEDIYKDKISNSRFNITKIYTEKELKNDTMKSLKIGKNEFAFDVTYQIQPKEGIDTKELTIPDGEYDEDLGWVKDIHRVGVLRYNEKKDSYSIDNFGTGW